MKLHVSFIALCSAAAVMGIPTAHAAEDNDTGRRTAWEASRIKDTGDGKITTGVARARDPLDSATSTSAMEESEIAKTSARSLSDLFRNIPGIRAEAGDGEPNGNYTIRGLPLVSSGAKYLQFQEDGMPVLEFGDIFSAASDTFIRADFNVGQIESIRGGSASTFASNAPGGVINLISKTGEVEGGSIQASAGVDYESYRTDFDYGGHLSDTTRFHIGGFYRTGNGPRHLGYTADDGGQIKFNVTREFSGGYVRFYGKYLNDRNAAYLNEPMRVTGTNSDPTYSDLPGFSSKDSSLLSPYVSKIPGIDANNNLTSYDLHDGYKALAKSIGFDVKFNVSDWSVTERMRYTDQSVTFNVLNPLGALPAVAVPAIFRAPGGHLVYATGPQKGQAINPLTVNGNGMMSLSLLAVTRYPDLKNFTNDLRIGRVWNVSGGDLTGTVGLYNARQNIEQQRALVNMLQDIVGDGKSALVDVIKPNGSPLTQDGVLTYYGPGFGYQETFDVAYTITAPYGSLNYHRGKLAIGASVRVDTGKVDGTARANTPANLMTIDVNGDGVISDAERTFPFAPYSNTTPINYRYHYVSYSGSVNYRLAESASVFARYSRGARAGADRLIFSPEISPADGSLVHKSSGYDPVKQAEVGFKYRNNGIALNVTGFWAKVRETNTQLTPNRVTGLTDLVLVQRSYKAYGAEFEGSVRRGPFSLTANATLTHAEITAAEDPTIVGNTPRHQAKLIFSVMPQYDVDKFTIGANVIGTTNSYAQDQDQLKMPGYVTVNPFVQIRPIDRVVLSLNVNNVFDVRALTSVASASIPATGVVMGQPLYGRTISTAVRLYF